MDFDKDPEFKRIRRIVSVEVLARRLSIHAMMQAGNARQASER